jgi:hypothetical protein
MSYLDQMNYGSMYGNSAYPVQMPMQGQQNPGIAGSYGAAPMVNGTGYNVGGQMMGGGAGMQTPQLTGWQKFGYIMDGIGAIGNIWGAVQANKLAKKQFNFQKEAYETNLKNQTQTYNTALSDRINARYVMEGKSTAERDNYLKENKL